MRCAENTLFMRLAWRLSAGRLNGKELDTEAFAVGGPILKRVAPNC